MRRWWGVFALASIALCACDDGDPDGQQQPTDARVGDTGDPLDGGPDAAVDMRRDQASVDMATIDGAPIDGATADMADLPPDQQVLDQAVDDALFDQGTDLGALDAAIDMQVDQAAPDMAPPPDLCARWDAVADGALVQAIHGELVETYRPIRPEADLGGTLNRYTTARHAMFVDVERPIRGNGVECVYTGRFVATGPDAEPDHADVNAEHVWPRSRMHPDEDGPLYEHQQSDVHHLYPSDSGANSTRGSLPFGVVVGDRNLDFLPAVEGVDRHGDRVFEPRDERKGDIARAVLYFSIRWGRGIGPNEEAALRAWVISDPVDDRERQRNALVEQVQGNRNPFVDCPELVPRIADFADFAPGDVGLPLP